MERPCGLLTAKNTPVPLRSISVEMEVKGFVADISATLEYRNKETNPVEAVFVFPVDSDAAVYNFQAMVDGKKIVGQIKEKQKAKDEYDDALSAGLQGFLLEEDNSSSDIFTCTVGNLPPGQDASVSFSLVQELALDADGALRFALPAVLNPRYTPAGTQDASVTHHIPRASAPPYTLDLKAQFHCPHGISRVQSNCGLTALEYLTQDKTSAKLSLTDGHRFDKDVELLIYYDDVHEPSAIVEFGVESAKPGTLMGDPTVMVNFYPSFPEKSSQVTSGEFIFLLDRSGSMECEMSNHSNGSSRIQSAKDTLLLLLKSLPIGCFFNIYGFGSHFDSFFPESVEYNQESMQTALEKLKGIEADMGGTEILQPLTAIYSKPRKPGHPRQLFVFTDGEVSNTKMVLAEVRKNASSHRCFSFGIGEGASTALIKGIAKAASGSHQFITGEERMQPKVLQSLKFALQPAVSNLTISWKLPPGLEVVVLSQPPTVVFNGQRSIVYGQLKGKVDPSLEAEASLKYSLGQQLVQNSTKFRLQADKTGRSTIHHLAAKTMIMNLESGVDRETEAVEKQIIEISTQANVISSHTAFIAINKDLNQAVQGPMIRRNIPLYHLIGCSRSSMVSALHYGSSKRLQMNNASLNTWDSAGPVQYFTGSMQSKGLKTKFTRFSCQGMPAYGGGKDHEEFLQTAGLKTKFTRFSCQGMPAYGGGKDHEEFLQTAESPVMKLISLQNANGSWHLDGSLETLLGLKSKEIRQRIPRQDIDQTLWVTVLAVIWLHTFGADTKDEWELLVEKSVSWIKANAGPDLGGCVKAGNDLLKTSVDPQIFGL
ncbi:von Willebrand factor A domain-containing protein 5A-like isoform X2 [Heptranchias perlo]|uniref:von Willebrand factor A domain-containing protein 5A-like isoform X2 n=1 Tax=Heptranchias perlo TaxID=212740 RepID=UPI003559E913